jgi:protocatechuate 3,4-dioxygenase, alpha subunit
MPLATPSQTAGPFVGIGTEWMVEPDSASEGPILISGDVKDGAGEPVTDAMLEFWQADPEGRFPSESPAWHGFRRALTDSLGRYRVSTFEPGRVVAADGTTQAPHIAVSIFARGLMQRLVTRIYLPGDTEALTADPLLLSLPTADRARLVARKTVHEGELEFDIRLQGDEESIFFEPW